MSEPGTSEPSAQPTLLEPLDGQAVVEQLQRLLDSETFASAPRTRELVTFVVTETLAGRGDRLNSRVLTRFALGKPATVDTRIDASGRVQAGRARDLLERYYAREGRDDPIVITIPRGQYGAVFTRAPLVPVAAAEERRGRADGTAGPLVVVANLAHSGTGRERRLAFGLAESLVHVLSTFPGLRVAGPVDLARQRASDDEVANLSTRVGASYVLHGRVTESDDTVRLSVRLIDAVDLQVRWTTTFDRTLDPSGAFVLEDEIAAEVAGAIGDFNGVILRDRSAAARDAGDARVADALRGYYAFLADLDPLMGTEVLQALEAARDLEPTNPTVLGCLASMHAVGVLLLGTHAQESMREAERLGHQTLTLDPMSAPAHNALAIVMLAKGRLAEAEQHARAVLRLTPFHPGNIYAAGMVIGACGDWDGGIDVVRRAVRLNPYGPSHQRTLLAVDALLRDDVAGALAEASLIHFPGHIYGPLLRLICLDELGMSREDAQHEREQVEGLVPGFFERPGEILSIAPTLPPHVVDALVERIERLTV